MKITGVTPERSVTDKHYLALKKMGVSKLRMINCLNETELVDGVFKYHSRLYSPLKKCDEFGFIPHIIIGQEPRWTTIPQNHKDFDWPLYEEYIKQTLTEVCINKGFTETIWEVGNEFLHGKTEAWLNPEGKHLAGYGNAYSKPVYDSYVYLYIKTAKAFMSFCEDHRELNIKLGGWASSPHQLVQTFAAQTRDVKRDFISLHTYVKQTKLSDLIFYTEKAKLYDDVKVLITEFGFDSYAVSNDPLVSYSFVKAFLDSADRMGISEVYALIAIAWSDNQQVIWETDGSLSNEGLAMTEASL